MKRVICILAVIALFLTGCAGSGDKKTFTSISDFEGVKIGSLTGSAFKSLIDPIVPDVTYKYFNSVADQAAALTSGKVDALSLDVPVAEYLVSQNTDLVIFPEVVVSDRYGFAVTKGSDLMEKANEVLQTLIDNGTINEVEDVWFSADESKKILPELTYKEDFDGSAGTLTYGCDNSNAPMSYVGSDGTPLGLDLDIISRIAYEMNMEVEFVPMNFDALLAALASGKIDIAGGCMSINEERKKSVDFVGPYYEGGVVFVIRKERLGN